MVLHVKNNTIIANPGAEQTLTFLSGQYHVGRRVERGAWSCARRLLTCAKAVLEVGTGALNSTHTPTETRFPGLLRTLGVVALRPLPVVDGQRVQLTWMVDLTSRLLALLAPVPLALLGQASLRMRYKPLHGRLGLVLALQALRMVLRKI